MLASYTNNAYYWKYTKALACHRFVVHSEAFAQREAFRELDVVRNAFYRFFSDGGGGGETWRNKFREQVSNLKDLPSDLGSFGPRKPEPSVRDRVMLIANNIKREDLPTPVVAATSGGGVQVKWTSGKGELSFFVYSDHSAEYLVRTGERAEPRSGEIRDFTTEPNTLVGLIFN